MALTRPPVLPVWADTGDKTQPSDAELSVGWPVTAIPPSRQRFNWFFSLVNNGVRYLTRRGVPDWIANETFEIGDIQRSTVDGKTYRALVGSPTNINFEPSANPLKWERWGFSLGELMVLLFSGIHGGNCPVTGPAAAPTLANPYTRYTSVAPCLEEWDWTGLSWKVVANDYRYVSSSASVNMGAGTVVNLITTAALPRAGRIIASGVISNLNNVSGGNILAGYLVLTRAGAQITLAGSLSNYTALALNQYMQARPYIPYVDVLEGDTLTLVGLNSNAGSLSPTNGNAIYYQYI